MVGKNYFKLKTSSIWGYPHKIYFRFLKKIEDRKIPKTLCILGCSDGKFVIPAAKRGFRVLALDIDKAALYGGKTTINNQEVIIDGLINRLNKEKVKKYVTVVDKDYLAYKPRATFSGVFTSGSIHYTENSKYSLNFTINKIKSYVSINGILLLEYIHTSTADNDPKRHFVTSRQIASFFNTPDWTIISNKKKKYLEEPNPRVAFTHKIVWGRLYAIRNK